LAGSVSPAINASIMAGQHAHDVGDDRIQFYFGVFQGLLDPLDMAAPLAHQLLAGPQEVTHLLCLLVRDEAAADPNRPAKPRR
jgi:hypothetical protein